MKVYTHEDVLKLMNRIQVYEINRDLCMLKLTPIDIEEKLLEYWNGGIKSTEEGGKSFDQYHNEHNEDKFEEIISKAHTKITRTKGKEYAPTSNEIQKEINATSSQTEISDEIFGQELFNYFSNQHNISLLQSEMHDIIDIVKKMEQTEISDEEIEKGAKEWYEKEGIVNYKAEIRAWVSACKWYREQLKQRQ